jgi:sugar/nucleoside kinase (ribokinase family)
MTKKYNLLGIGNAIVDVIAYESLEFLEKNGLPHGSMALVDQKTSDKLYKKIGTATECPGGSVANTLAGFAMLGGKAAFIGKVADDLLGNFYKKDMQKVGVDFLLSPQTDSVPTARCLIMVTEESGKNDSRPKIERTMATYLGASVNINEKDILEEYVADSEILLIEGYLFDTQNARNAVYKAINYAKKHGTKVAFSLSDPLCVQRHKYEFINLIHNEVDIIFCNNREIGALFDSDDIRKILFNLKGVCEVSCVTRGEKGSYILSGEEIYDVEAVKTDEVYDVTGAGDLYAAGFLYGYVNKFEPEKSGQLASLCATEVIEYLGARPVTKISELLKQL